MRGTTNANYRFGETVESGYVTVQPIKNLTANGNDGNINLSWDALSFNTVTTTTKIDIRYKPKTDANTYFSSVTDGTLATSIPIIFGANATSYTITNVTAGQEYLVSVVAWGYVANVGTSSLVPATSAEQIVSVTPSAYKKWTVIIDESNSNPLSCCTYADDAVGMTKGSDAWDEIFDIKPCVLKNGAVYKYVNSNDFTKYVDGSSVSSSDGDVMIEFPRFGMNLENDGNGVITVSMSPDTNAFGSNGLDTRVFSSKNKFYLGAYLASNAQNGLLSVSDVAPETNINLTNAIAYAQKKGSGYDIMGFYQWTYVQCLYLLKYGNLNSQAALGKGYVNGSAKQNTGATNDKGMCYGNTSSSTDRVKLFGLEDAWGNIYQWLGGLYCDSSFNLLTKTSNFTTGTTASDYDFSTPSGLTSSFGTWLSQTQGTNGGGFVGKTGGGSTTTYWSDYGYVNAGCFDFVGGDWSDGDDAGLFSCSVNFDASYALDDLGCRLQYL